MTNSLHCRIQGSQMARVSSEAPSGNVWPDMDFNNKAKKTRQLLDHYRFILFGHLSLTSLYCLQPYGG